MRSSYLEDDVTILLKDISGLVQPLPTTEREKLIQSGVHYSEMLPLEYKPSREYIAEYSNALEAFGEMTANAVKTVSERIYRQKGASVALVSLARAGTPVGILIKRYLKKKYGVNVPHYTISIIRGKGIDRNAMKHILKNHPPQNLQFVDGWTGKGAILRELEKEVAQYKGVNPSLAVLADPANITSLCGTHEDFLIASSCLNATVSGLISRTFFRSDIISETDFHGAAFYGELQNEDRTYEFIDYIESRMDFNFSNIDDGKIEGITGVEEVNQIAVQYGVKDINFIKPGVGETTRVLLRRVPDIVLVNDFKDTKHISHILRLAEEKNVKVAEYPLKRYRACGIIKTVAADV